METRLGLREADALAERVLAIEIARIERHPHYAGGFARATLEMGVAKTLVTSWVDCLRHGEVHAWPPPRRPAGTDSSGVPIVSGPTGAASASRPRVSSGAPFVAMAGVRVRRDPSMHETHAEILFLCDPARAGDGDLAFRVLHPILSRIDELAKSLRARDWIAMPKGEYGEAIDILRNGPAGLFVDSVHLRGTVETARERMAAKGLDAATARAVLASKGFVVRPLTQEVDIEAFVDLQAREFSRNPRFGWFLARPGVLHDQRAALRGHLAEVEPKGSYWVIEKAPVRGAAPTFAGVIGSSWKNQAPWGTQAGTTVMLEPAFQRKGLAGPLYAILFGALSDAGVRLVHGGTSQPAILRIAAETGRTLDSVILRRGEDPFGPAHFAPFLPDRRG